MRQFQHYVLLALSAILPLLAISAENQPPLDANEIKAGLLLKLPSYVEWPTNMNGKAGGKIVVGLFGDDGLKQLLEKLVAGAQGRPIEVRKVNLPAEINQCHVLFVPRASNATWLALKKDVNLQGLLTMGESDDFLQQGGVCVFRINENPRVWVNRKNQESAGVKISPQFLRYTKVIK